MGIRDTQCVKTHIFVQKFIFWEILLINLFEFLRQNSEIVDPQMHQIFDFSYQKSRIRDKNCVFEN